MQLCPIRIYVPHDSTCPLAQGKAAWALKTTSYFGLWYFFNIFVSTLAVSQTYTLCHCCAPLAKDVPI
jgi:hypothetical protein